jgi:hypothetical protein
VTALQLAALLAVAAPARAASDRAIVPMPQ